MTSGKYLTVMIGGMSPVEEPDSFAWSVDDDVKELDRTVGADGGFGDVDDGVRRATINISFYVDIANATTVVTDMQPGSVIETLALFYHIEDETPAYEFPLCMVLKATLGSEVDGQFQVKATLKNKKAFIVRDPVGV